MALFGNLDTASECLKTCFAVLQENVSLPCGSLGENGSFALFSEYSDHSE
jgi:hypothetical protein